MYFVYVLESENYHHWYIGFTEDVRARLFAHNAGMNTSTSSHCPWKIIYFEAYLHKMDALGRERFLKSGSGHKFLRKQISRYLAEAAAPREPKTAQTNNAP